MKMHWWHFNACDNKFLESLRLWVPLEANVSFLLVWMDVKLYQLNHQYKT